MPGGGLMVRHLYGGSTSDYTAEVVNGYQRRVGGVILDVRRVDTKAGVTDLVTPPDWDGVAFPTGRVISDRDGDVRFLGPDGLTARLEVRTTATGNRRAGDWWLLDGQPPPIVEGDLSGLRATLEAYVRQQVADAALGEIDTTGLVTQAQLQAAIDQALASVPNLPDLEGLVTEADARSIADQAAAAALAAYVPPSPDLSPYALRSDVDVLRSALAAALMRLDNLENGTSPTDPPADAYADTYADAY